MSESAPNIVPLGRAVICIDCAAISDSKNVCAACSSRAIVPLHKFLERQKVTEVIRVEQLAAS